VSHVRAFDRALHPKRNFPEMFGGHEDQTLTREPPGIKAFGTCGPRYAPRGSSRHIRI
jgi:hypothetical protein